MFFANDEKYGTFRTSQMDSLPRSRNFGGIRNGFNNPVHLSSQTISYSPMASGTKSAGVEGSRLNQSENEASHGYVSHEPSSNIDPTIVSDPDCLMTTPDSSRHDSESLPDAVYCQCRGSARTSGNSTGNSRTLPLRLVSGGRLPSIAMMLNDPSCRDPIHSTGNHLLPQSISDNRMSLSNTSESTIVVPVSISEQRYSLLNSLYRTCLDATTTYIRALPQSSLAGLRSGSHHSHSTRYHPYPGRAWERSYNDDHSKTLMDNIEAISTFLWRKARRDEMAPHRAESDAVIDMNNLYRWGESLVNGMEERAGDERARTEVLHAAIAMCGWLGDPDACTLCREVGGELKDLMDLETQREENEDGDIL
ncbi:hypothetical protein NHQ30_000184 [Ciborinia camelliae]|nr:hypothetical protein NHQ30_000184 [Ciborinia camelliae]